MVSKRGKRGSEAPRKVAKDVFNEFCDSSTIHGLKYLGTRSLHDKIMWLLVFCVSVCLCGFQIHAIWNKWNESPVIISFNENIIPISEINFPAITVCHQIKTTKSAFNYGKLQHSLLSGALNDSHSSQLDLFELVAFDCLRNGGATWEVQGRILSLFANRSSELRAELLAQVAPTPEETLSFCKGILSPRKWDCLRGFGTILTEDGVCYTFNMLNHSEIFKEGTDLYFQENFPPSHLDPVFNVSKLTPDNDELEFLKGPFYPLRAFTTGQKLHLKLASRRSDYDPSCPGSGDRFKIYIHNPHELPWSQHATYDVDTKHFIKLWVKPSMVVATERMRHAYEPEKRRCYFEQERNLRYFRHYTKSNCELECWANISRAKCGCVPYWMPKDLTTAICGLKDYKCVQWTSRFHLNIETAFATYDFTKGNRDTFNCRCFSACSSIKYEAEMKVARLFSYTEKVAHVDENQDNETDGEALYEISKVMVMFKEQEFFALKRSELYGLTDFIANCGGLLGLFMGVSLLSFFEIFYFCTVRCVSRFSKKRTSFKEIQ